MSIRVENMSSKDYADVLHIYYLGILTELATFETEVPSWEEWDSKHLPNHRFVAKEANKVVGWVALSSTSSRKVYRGRCELSIYVHTDYLNKGIGSLLLEKLIPSSEKAGIWTLQSGVFPENQASIGLHLKFGFHIVGTSEKIGQLHGKWRDVVLLERRSALI